MANEQRYENGQVKFIFDRGQLDWITNRLKGLSPLKRDGAIEKGFILLTAETESELKYKIVSGQVLKVRSGRLLTSIGSVVGRSSGELVGLVGSGVRNGHRVPYANIHETGGRIVAKNPSGYLKIPIRSGGTGGRRVSFSSKVVGYRFVKSVTIPARRYMSKAVERIEPRAVGIMLDAIDDEVAKQK